MSAWIPVIGLEVHARLLTATKLFCGCSAQYGARPNQNVCPVCLAYPGTLPTLNRTAVELAIRAALATSCTIAETSLFARKHYFYPDLPRGYQITQHEHPLASGGSIPVVRGEKHAAIRIQRIHIEEDAGKLLHETPWSDVPADRSLVDLNRAGVPLIEIVSDPDIRSSGEAAEYVGRLRQVLMYAGVSDGNMEEGSLRVDANVSVHRAGTPHGTRAEVKNLNSFRFLSRAIDFEIDRQTALLESGGAVVQETRTFDSRSGQTSAMRSKEEAHDYRYFTEPDLSPLEVSREWIERVRASLPELPEAKLERYERNWDVPHALALVLVATPPLAEYFEAAATASRDPRATANWVSNEVLAIAKERSIDLSTWELRPDLLAALVDLVADGTVSGNAAKTIFERMVERPEDPAVIADRLGLGQIQDPSAIREFARTVLERSATQLAQYRAGKTQLFGYLVGAVLRESGGRASPEIVNRILRELLAEEK